MRFKTFSVCVPMFFLAFQATADSAVIDFSLTALGGSEYQYNYTVHNDGSLGAGVPIQLFDIDFSPALYQAGSLNIVSLAGLNSAWSQEILVSVGTAPADFDVLALGGGIPVGGTVSGFAVQFEWIGKGLPGAQQFEISDPNSFKVLETGETMTSSTTLPEPSTFQTLAMVLILAFAILLAGSRSAKALTFKRRAR
jgi:hypothetical protein